MIMHSFDLFSFLFSLNLLKDSPSWWWPNHGDFEVVVAAILTQNTRWENVQKSLQNLYKQKLLIYQDNERNLQTIANCDPYILSSLIASSGFANQKASRLVILAKNILEDFMSYEHFVQEVDGEWLIAQKGIGKESRDCILNYACLREVMVVDRYTYKLLCSYGFEMQDYDEIQDWITRGISQHLDKIQTFYTFDISLAQIYARLHGKIVEFGKKGFKI